jgi:hypothetical protein
MPAHASQETLAGAVFVENGMLVRRRGDGKVEALPPLSNLRVVGAGMLAVGLYTGNGTAGRLISVPFHPIRVEVRAASAVHWSPHRNGGGNGYRISPKGQIAWSALPTVVPVIVPEGFLVSAGTDSPNITGVVYTYQATGVWE